LGQSKQLQTYANGEGSNSTPTLVPMIIAKKSNPTFIQPTKSSIAKHKDFASLDHIPSRPMTRSQMK